MDSRFDRTSTITVEGTTENLKAHVDRILANGGRIMSVKADATVGSDKSPTTFKIVYADSD